MRVFTVSFFLACVPAEVPLMLAVAVARDESIFDELPVILPNDDVTVLLAASGDDTVPDEHVLFVLPTDDDMVVFAAITDVEPIASTTSFDGEDNVCSSSICSTRQNSL